MAPFQVGIDGGGSGTRAWLTDASGRLLGCGSAGASSLRLGAQAAWGEIRAATHRAFDAAGLAPAPTPQLAIALGLAGLGVSADVQAFLQAAPPFARLLLDSDAIAAVLGAHGGVPGCVVASGTGSVGAVWHAEGQHRLVGGWGFPVGDEGSGAWLGLRAMRHVQQVADGRAADGALAAAVRAQAGTQRSAWLDWCAGADASRYASLAPAVFDSAGQDAAADALLERAAQALADLALALDGPGRLPLALMGSIGQRLVNRLPADVRRRCVPVQGDAAQGAWRMLAWPVGVAAHERLPGPPKPPLKVSTP